MMDFDATQAIILSDYNDDTDESGDESSRKPLGFLKVFTQKGFQEKEFPVYEGKNFIGRSEDNEIVVPIKSLSKQHVCIEVQEDSHLIYDLESRNKSRRGKLFLQPNVRYELKHDDRLVFADVACQYLHASHCQRNDEGGSGSETGSELMLDALDSDGMLKPVYEGSKEAEPSDQNPDLSDCIQPTQPYTGVKSETLQLKTPAGPQVDNNVLVHESDEEESEKKGEFDISKVEESGSETDVEAYANDTGDFSVTGEDIASAATQAYGLDDKESDNIALATTQAYGADGNIALAATLAYGADDNIAATQAYGSDDAIAATQAYGTDDTLAATQAYGADVALAATQAYGADDAPTQHAGKGGAPTLVFNQDSDESESDDEDATRGRSLFEAATQAYNPWDTSEADKEDNDDDKDVVGGHSLFEAETQAYGLEDDIRRADTSTAGITLRLNMTTDEESTPDAGFKKPNRVSIASTIPLNISSDLETSAKKTSQQDGMLRTPAKMEDLSGLDDSTQSYGEDLEESAVSDKKDANAKPDEGGSDDDTDIEGEIIPFDEPTQAVGSPQLDCEGEQGNSTSRENASDKSKGMPDDQSENIPSETIAVSAFKETVPTFTVPLEDAVESTLAVKNCQRVQDTRTAVSLAPTLQFGETNESDTEDDAVPWGKSNIHDAPTVPFAHSVSVESEVNEGDSTKPPPCPVSGSEAGGGKIGAEHGADDNSDEAIGSKKDAKDEDDDDPVGATVAYGIGSVENSEEKERHSEGARQDSEGTTGPGIDPTVPYTIVRGNSKSLGTSDSDIFRRNDKNFRDNTAEEDPTCSMPEDGAQEETQAYGLEDDADDDLIGGTQAYGIDDGDMVPDSQEASSNTSASRFSHLVETDAPSLPVLPNSSHKQPEATIEQPEATIVSPIFAPPAVADKTKGQRGLDDVSIGKNNDADEEDLMDTVDAGPMRKKSGDEGILKRKKMSIKTEVKVYVGRAMRSAVKRVKFSSKEGDEKSEEEEETVVPKRSKTSSKKGTRSGMDKEEGDEETEKIEETGEKDEMKEMEHPSRRKRKVGMVEQPEIADVSNEKEAMFPAKRQRKVVCIQPPDVDSFHQEGETVIQDRETKSEVDGGRLKRQEKVVKLEEEEKIGENKEDTVMNSSRRSARGRKVKAEEGKSSKTRGKTKQTAALSSEKTKGRSTKMSMKGKEDEKSSPQTLAEVFEKKSKRYGKVTDEKSKKESETIEESKEIESAPSSSRRGSTRKGQGGVIQTEADGGEADEKKHEAEEEGGRGLVVKEEELETEDIPKKKGQAKDEGKKQKTPPTTTTGRKSRRSKTIDREENEAVEEDSFQGSENMTEIKEDVDQASVRGRRGSNRAAQGQQQEGGNETTKNNCKMSSSKPQRKEMEDVQKENEMVVIESKRSKRTSVVSKENDTAKKTVISDKVSKTKEMNNSQKEKKDEDVPSRKSRRKRTSESSEGTAPRGNSRQRQDEETQSNASDVSSTSLDSSTTAEGKTDGSFLQPNPVKGRRGYSKQRVQASDTADKKLEVPNSQNSNEGSQGSTLSKDDLGTPTSTRKGRRTSKVMKKSEETSSTPPINSSQSKQRATPTHSPAGSRGHSRSSSQDSSSPSLRRRSIDPKPKVMFTGVIDKSGEKIVTNLGGELVDSVFKCTHLVTDKVRRTVKFLCCLSTGALIVSPDWLEQSKLEKKFADASEFLLNDKAAEKQYKFSLVASRQKAVEGAVLTGWRVHVTPSVKPDPAQMKDIIKCAGGEFISRVPCEKHDKTIVISCIDDAMKCLPAVEADIPIVGAEFILTGLLRQAANPQTFLLPIPRTTDQKTAAASSTPKARSGKRRR